MRRCLKSRLPRVPAARCQSNRSPPWRNSATICWLCTCLNRHSSTSQSHATFGSAAPEVEKVSYADETIWLDRAQSYGFEDVPEDVWNFHIGGYQVCEKWLKDRQAKGGKNPRSGRTLTDEDMAHDQRIVVAITRDHSHHG
ncbi:MAG: type ISP restriction/modification enzyme [Xanthomonadales bacterium]|nr:type ISP restriction/modification enzyme [Xanthomonadales bacterium]